MSSKKTSYIVLHNDVRVYDGESQSSAMKAFFDSKNTSRFNNRVELFENDKQTFEYKT